MNRSAAAVPLTALLLAALFLLGGCQGYQDGSSRTVGEFTDDVGIQARVKLALLNDTDIKGLRIDTEVRRGVVTLQGRVGSRELQRKAVRIAAEVKGVKEVKDRLTVVTE